jgi:putative ABC transport system permease protein
VVAGLAWIGGRRAHAVVALELALPQLRAPEWRARSLAIATTGAIAVFGAVALQGARANLQAGLDGVSRDLNDVTDVWVSPYGAGGVLATTPFAPEQAVALARVPGVLGVGLYRGGFLDLAGRRVWVVGPPADSPELVPASQVLDGGARLASARVRAGGWATLSRAVADGLHLEVGDRFTLPAPVPRTLRLAAITTNLGWSSGAVILNADDYAGAARSDAVGAYQVRLAPGVSAEAGRDRVAAALGRGAPLRVETAAQRRARWDTVSRSGLSRLRQIAALSLVVAILAMAAAMAGLLWQRRPEVARQKLDGHRTTVMWRALVIESGTLIGTGCLAGGLFALLGQVLFSRGLQTISGFPVDVSVRIGVAALSLALVTAVALLVVAVPGYLVARVRPSLRTGD